jgi:hypothetical protein
VTEPLQYRAIGLVRGIYQPSAEQFTRGSITTEDGTVLDAVLLGRVLSLMRNHLDLDQSHLWVVYPRTREVGQGLHVQVVGVWEPETLHQPVMAPGLKAPSPPRLSYPDNFFSIRGEVIHYRPQDRQVVVRICQKPRPTDERPPQFKLVLRGELPSFTLHHFWELQTERQGEHLVIRSAKDIGALPRPRPILRKEGKGSTGAGLRRAAGYRQGDRPTPRPRPSMDRPQRPSRPASNGEG